MLPLYIPVLIFGAGAASASMAGMSAGGHLSLLGAFLLFRGFQIWMKPSMIGTDKVEPKAKPAQDSYIARLEEELKKQK